MKTLLNFILILNLTVSISYAQTERIDLNGHGQGLILANSADQAGTYIMLKDHDNKQASIATFDDNFADINFRNTLQFIARNGKDIRFATSSDESAGSNKFVILNNGNVGIGDSNPLSKLSIAGNDTQFNIKTESNLAGTLLTSGQSLHMVFDDNMAGTDYFSIRTKGATLATSTELFRITSNGNVGVGTASTGSHKLAVEGSIGAREIKVEASGWSDFVFENDYELRTLEEIEKYIAENKHLPGIPSETEVIEDGINLGEMNAKLLQKIEELTLYLIEQNKKLEIANSNIAELKREVSVLKQN